MAMPRWIVPLAASVGKVLVAVGVLFTVCSDGKAIGFDVPPPRGDSRR